MVGEGGCHKIPLLCPGLAPVVKAVTVQGGGESMPLS